MFMDWKTQYWWRSSSPQSDLESQCNLNQNPSIFFVEINPLIKKFMWRDFPGCPVVKNLPANAEDVGLILDPGRSHMLRGS